MIKALVLEGPAHEIMRGWRHFQIIVRVDGRPKVSSCVALNGSGESTARALRGKFFMSGTWENDSDEAVADVRRFPAPKPEILDLLICQYQPDLRT